MAEQFKHYLVIKGINPFKWRLYIGKYYSITLKKLISFIPALVLFFIYSWSTWVSEHTDKAIDSIERWCHDE